MKDDEGLSAGIELGKQVAAAAVRHAANDGSAHAEALLGIDYFPGPAPASGARIRSAGYPWRSA